MMFRFSGYLNKCFSLALALALAFVALLLIFYEDWLLAWSGEPRVLASAHESLQCSEESTHNPNKLQFISCGGFYDDF